MSAPLYQHVRADSVAPRLKTLSKDWPEWKFSEGTTHIVYDGNYGSERVLILSGQATIEPDDGSPSFNLGPGDGLGRRCSWWHRGGHRRGEDGTRGHEKARCTCAGKECERIYLRGY